MKILKKIIIGLFMLIVIGILSFVLFLYTGLEPVSNQSEVISFTIEYGTSKTKVIEDLYEAGIIKSSLALKIYLYFDYNSDFLAGTYEIDKSLGAVDVIEILQSGSTDENVVTVTFTEGKRLTEYAEVISQNFDFEYDEVMKVLESEEFLNYLIENYEIITEEILNSDIYYSLEGYLFADTYEFYADASIEQIIEKMVSHGNDLISPYLSDIYENYSIHDIITIASISELEANSSEDRKSVAQVIYTRLNLNMTLGMDVTAYYGAQLSMSEEITYDNGLSDENPYNTRISTFYGLPVGPICNPSLSSVLASIYPNEEFDYVYFIADENTGEVNFFTTYSDFLAFKND